MTTQEKTYLEEECGVVFDKNGRPICFNAPMQVRFLDTNAEEPMWIGGIAIGGQIICGCCGGVIFLEEVWTEVTDYWQVKGEVYTVTDDEAFTIFESWVDISRDIKGDDSDDPVITPNT